MNPFLKTLITALAPVAGYLVQGMTSPTGGFADYLNAHPSTALVTGVVALLIHNMISHAAPPPVGVEVSKHT